MNNLLKEFKVEAKVVIRTEIELQDGADSGAGEVLLKLKLSVGL